MRGMNKRERLLGSDVVEEEIGGVSWEAGDVGADSSGL